MCWYNLSAGLFCASRCTSSTIQEAQDNYVTSINKLTSETVDRLVRGEQYGQGYTNIAKNLILQLVTSKVVEISMFNEAQMKSMESFNSLRARALREYLGASS